MKKTWYRPGKIRREIRYLQRKIEEYSFDGRMKLRCEYEIENLKKLLPRLVYNNFDSKFQPAIAVIHENGEYGYLPMNEVGTPYEINQIKNG